MKPSESSTESESKSESNVITVSFSGIESLLLLFGDVHTVQAILEPESIIWAFMDDSLLEIDTPQKSPTTNSLSKI